MKMFGKVVIIGTGLIGGSLGLALKKQRLCGRVIGLSRRRENAVLAQKNGAIDEIAGSLEAVSEADLVVLATPVDKIIDFGLRIRGKIRKDCIVIDVGSTKETIVSKLSPLIPNFVGCHPLAGSEKRGAANLKENIFKGSLCILTPADRTSKRALSTVKLFWKELGARTVELSAKKHDQVLALTSHLPHFLAFSLINSVPEGCLRLSSNGLKDTTRLSASDPELWSEIFFSNRANLLAALTVFEIKLTALKLALKNNDRKKLAGILRQAQTKRKLLG